MKHKLIHLLPALVSAALLTIQAGCAGSSAQRHSEGASRAKPEVAVAARMRHAAHLSRLGRHYDASFQLEAALDAGGEEVQLLPRLAAAQIRAGRLRAAKKTLVRLTRLVPQHPQVSTLLQMLETIAPSPEAGRRKEKES